MGLLGAFFGIVAGFLLGVRVGVALARRKQARKA